MPFSVESALPLLFALAFGVSTAQSQTAVCSNTPGAGDRVECKEDAASTSGITIELMSVDIDTTDDTSSGVHAEHLGVGVIDIDILEAGTIDTSGIASHGIHAKHTGTGDIEIDVLSPTTITTNGAGIASGIYAEHEGAGDIDILISSSTVRILEAEASDAVDAQHIGNGNITINIDGSTIETFTEKLQRNFRPTHSCK